MNQAAVGSLSVIIHCVTNKSNCFPLFQAWVLSAYFPFGSWCVSSRGRTNELATAKRVKSFWEVET